MSRIRSIFLMCLVLIFAAPDACAQPKNEKAHAMYSFENAHVVEYHSKIVNADYKLYISLPRDYRSEKQSYPVMYVLDADYCFAIVDQISRFLCDHDELPPVIIVGIAYPGVSGEKYGPIHKTARTRDYTPTHVTTGGYGAEFQKASGGADHFLDFVQKELAPYIESEYRAKQDRTIVGYSYGGLLASYALETRPALFQRYIAVSPSLWWDDRFLFRVTGKQTQSNQFKRAYFGVGSYETAAHGEKEMVKDLKEFVEYLNKKKNQNLETRMWIAEGEDHHSIFPGAAMRGIRWIFSGH